MATVETQPCSKCHGTGTITRYGHVVEGICFQCKGSGVTKKRREIKEKVKAGRPEPKRWEDLSEDERQQFYDTFNF